MSRNDCTLSTSALAPYDGTGDVNLPPAQVLAEDNDQLEGSHTEVSEQGTAGAANAPSGAKVSSASASPAGAGTAVASLGHEEANDIDDAHASAHGSAAQTLAAAAAAQSAVRCAWIVA